MSERPRPIAEAYDAYWSVMDRERTAVRSRERAEAALDLLESVGACSGRLLDIGCGPGWALEIFAREGLAATGLDVSARAVNDARQRGLEAHQVDIGNAGFEEILEGLGGPFDIVTALEVLEHMEDPLNTLRKLLRLVAPGGKVVISLPNEIHLAARLRILLGWLPFGGHDDPHVRHFDLQRARTLFDAAGCRVGRRRFLSLVPPRWPFLRWVTAPLVSVVPGLLALSAVVVLEGPANGRE